MTETEEADTPLHTACRQRWRCDFDKVFAEIQSLVLDVCPTINVQNFKGETPLLLACRTCQYCPPFWQVVLLLLSRNADANVPNRELVTPLHEACGLLNINVIQLLLKGQNGANPEALDKKGKTPLHWACAHPSGASPELIQLLVNYGADPNAQDHSGATPLHLACEWAAPKAVRCLMDLGAKIDVTTHNDEAAPLHKAGAACALDVVKILVAEGAGVNVQDGRGLTPFGCACLGWHTRAPHTDAPRIARVLSWLAKAGADVNVKDKEDGATPLFRACETRAYGVVQHLLSLADIDVEASNKSGQTVLHRVCQMGDLRTAQKLVFKGGANVNAVDNQGTTPLLEACCHGHPKVMKLLVQEGANTDAQDRQGATALHSACRGGYFRRIRLLVESEANVDIADSAGRTPLHEACRSGSGAAVRYLVDKGAKVNVRDHQGNTPLHEACRSAGSGLYHLRYLVENGANVNEANRRGRTPLHLACRWGSLDAVKLLVAEGATPEPKDDRGDTPLVLAAEHNWLRVVRWMVEHCFLQGNT